MTQVLVSSIAESGLKQEITAGDHKLISDAGKDIGGDETGLNPHELLLAALGACTSMTLKIFSQRRGWKLDEVRVKLNEDMIEDANNPGKKIAKITRDIEVKGELTTEQLDTLKSIADKCPIHKILTDSKQIITQLESLN